MHLRQARVAASADLIKPHLNKQTMYYYSERNQKGQFCIKLLNDTKLVKHSTCTTDMTTDLINPH